MTVTMISTATIAETSWYNEIDKTTSNVNNELSDTAISKKSKKHYYLTPPLTVDHFQFVLNLVMSQLPALLKMQIRKNKSFRSLKKLMV